MDPKHYFKAKTLVPFTTSREKLTYPAGTEVMVIDGLPHNDKEVPGDYEAFCIEVQISPDTQEFPDFDWTIVKAEHLDHIPGVR